MGKIYYATADGYFAGAHRKKGDAVGPITDRQAHYPVLAGLLSTTPPAEQEKDPPRTREADPATLGRKTR